MRYAFDGYINGTAAGWVADLKNTDKRFNVGLYVNGALNKTAEASNFRNDLKEHGLGDGRYSFSIDLPENLEGECWIEILDSGQIISESVRKFGCGDAACDELLRARNFAQYAQFKHVTAKRIAPQQFRRTPNRLIRALNNTHSSGIGIPAYAEWVIERNRRGGAAFFDTPEPDFWSDLLWYLFDFNSREKHLVELDNTNSLMRCAMPPPYDSQSLLFITWLLRRGAAVHSITALPSDTRASYLGALISANVNATHDPVLSGLESTVNKRPRSHLGNALPRLSKYLIWKHKVGYSNAYDLDVVRDYLAFLFDSILHATSVELPFFGKDVLAYFADEVEISGASVSRMEFLLASFAQIASEPKSADTVLQREQITKFFDEKWLPSHPQHILFQSSRVMAKAARTYCSYIVAHWDSESGLTQNAHMTFKAMRNLGIECVRLYPNGNIYNDGARPAASTQKLQNDLVILHVNADDAPDAMFSIANVVDLDTAKVVGFYLWELAALPKAHLLGCNLVDEIWVPTKFVKDAYSELGAKVKLVGKALQIPSGLKTVRKSYSIPSDAFTFLLSFDYHSCVERKNPVTAVRAFQAAFTQGENVCMVVKTTEFVKGHWGDPYSQWSQVSRLAENDERIIIIEDFLENSEFFNLIYSVDAVISPHRAEGFGYLPAYAIALGKDAVTTNYSGNTDYCTLENSYLVKSSLRPVPCGKFVYPIDGAVWAEVDHDDFVTKLTECFKQKRFKPKDRAKASQALLNHYGFEALSKTYQKRLVELGIICKN